MLGQKTSNQNVTAWKGDIPVTSLYTVGIAGQKFLAALKEKGEILGTRCAKCQQTYVPARMFCERCFAELSEYVPVAQEGTLVSFTVCHIDLEGKPLKNPVAVGAIQLDGASTVLIHYVKAKLQELAIGKRVRVALLPKAKRRGSILDIEGFQLA